MKKQEYAIGDLVYFKKGHPCGGNEWEILRIGADFKVKCTSCGRLLMMTRRKFEKNVRGKIDK